MTLECFGKDISYPTFNKVVNLQACNSIKKTVQYRCFPFKNTFFYRIPPVAVSQEHSYSCKSNISKNSYTSIFQRIPIPLNFSKFRNISFVSNKLFFINRLFFFLEYFLVVLGQLPSWKIVPLP